VVVDAARRASAPAPILSALARLAAIPARWALAGIVTVSFAARALLSLAHATPTYLPDEYIYSELARSFATSGRPLIRGELVSFPALLEPLLAAPFWLGGNVELAYRLTLGLHALAMSLAAVPAYLLCRRLGLGKWLGVASGAIAVSFPALVLSSYVTADAVAYPLALTAVWLGVRALEQPAARAQLAFLGAAGLATFARVQYVVLPVAFLAAALVVERWRIRAAVRLLRPTLLLLALPVAAVAALGVHRVLGYYAGVTDLPVGPLGLARALATQVMGVSYAAGFVLLPGALVALALGVARPQARAEAAFAALTTVFACSLLGEAALYAASDDPGRFKERYVVVLPALAVPAFGLWLKRGAPARRAVAALSVGFLLLSVRVPLSGYAVAENKFDSPFLQAFYRLERLAGTGDGAFIVALVALGLCALAAAVAFRPRQLAPLALALTFAAGALASAGAHAHDHEIARRTALTYLPENKSWIDEGQLRDVALLVTPGSPRALGFEQLFWNRSLRTVLQMRNAEAVDAFRSYRTRIAADGTILAAGKPVVQPLLVSQYAATVTLQGAERVGGGVTYDLWQPVGTPRISTLAEGRYFDGWLALDATVTVWPDETGRTDGTLTLSLGLPETIRATRVALSAPGYTKSFTLSQGVPAVIHVPVSGTRPFTLRIASQRPLVLPDGRYVSIRAAPPVFDRAAGEPSFSDA